MSKEKLYSIDFTAEEICVVADALRNHREGNVSRKAGAGVFVKMHLGYIESVIVGVEKKVQPSLDDIFGKPLDNSTEK